MSSEVIKDFMEAYGFIQARQIVPDERSFPETVRLKQGESMLVLIAESNAKGKKPKKKKREEGEKGEEGKDEQCKGEEAK